MIVSNDEQVLNEIKRLACTEEEKILLLTQQVSETAFLKHFKTFGPGLVILDDDLLSPNSVHYLKLLRSHDEEIPVIFITANNAIELGQKISSLGIQFYAHKPLQRGLLKEATSALLRHRKSVKKGRISTP